MFRSKGPIVAKSKFPQGTPITSVWLMHEGAENSNGQAVVLVEVDGKWYELIREPEGCPYSHMSNVTSILETDKPQFDNSGWIDE